MKLVKDTNLLIRLSSAEKLALQEIAKEKGTNVSAYVRNKVLK